MAYTPVPTKADGDASYTAADINIYIRDNWLAGAPDIFTTAGDMCYASAADIAARLAVGAVGRILRSNGTIPAWAVHPVAQTAAKGSLIAATTEDTLAYVTVGPNISHLVGDSAQSAGIRWSNHGAARITDSSPTQLTDATWTGVTFDTTEFDVASKISVSTYRVPVTGYYFVSVSALLLASSAGWTAGEKLLVEANDYTDSSTPLSILGETYIHAGGNFPVSVRGEDILYLTVDHQIQIRAYQDSGGSINTNSNSFAKVAFIRIGI